MGVECSKKTTDVQISSNIFEAVIGNDLNYVRTSKFDVNSKDCRDFTALILSVFYKRWEIFVNLLDRHPNIDLNVQNDLGDTALLIAIRKQLPQFALRLIRKGADVNLSGGGKTTPLHLAVEFSTKEVTLELLSRGANPNVINLLAVTPLDDAVQSNDLEIVSMLLCYGASTDVRTGILTSLMYAIMVKAPKEIQTELLNFSSPLETCKYNSTVTLAIQYESPILREIIEHFDVNFYDGFNAIDLAVWYQLDLSNFARLWDKFNYETWICTFRKSVLFYIFDAQIDDFILKFGYIKIIAYSDKIGAVLDHHYSSTFRETDWIISEIFQLVLTNDNNSSLMQDVEELVCYLLTQGMWVSSLDLDVVYTSNFTSASFLRTLLHMDIIISEDTPLSITRMKCNIIEHAPLELFKIYLLSEDLTVLNEFRLKFVMETFKFFTVSNVFVNEEEGEDYEFRKKLKIPSLVQLTRDCFRTHVITTFKIKNSGMLESVLKYSSLPAFICDILMYDRPIY